MQGKRNLSEKGFSFIILLLALVLLLESIKMFMKDPIASSFGAMPLFLSLSIVGLMLKIITAEGKDKESENNRLSYGVKVKESFKYVFTKDIIVVFLLMLTYCVVLFMGLGFEISTTIFLFVAMSYLMGKQYMKSLLYTAVSMAFILLVFKTIFKVILP